MNGGGASEGQAGLHHGRALARLPLDRGPHPDAHHTERAHDDRRHALPRASVLVYFEYRNELLSSTGSARRLRRRLGPRHPRRRARARGRQDDAVRRVPRLDDRPRRRGAMLGAIALVFHRDEPSPWRSPSPLPASPARSSSATRARGRRRSGCAATSASAPAPSASWSSPPGSCSRRGRLLLVGRSPSSRDGLDHGAPAHPARPQAAAERV